MKKFFKAFVYLLICILLIASFSACGKKDVADENGLNENQVESSESNANEKKDTGVTYKDIAEHLEKLKISEDKQDISELRNKIVLELKKGENQSIDGVVVDNGGINNNLLSQKLSEIFKPTEENDYEKFYDFLKGCVDEETDDISEKNNLDSLEKSNADIMNKLLQIEDAVKKSGTSKFWFVLTYLLLILAIAILLFHNLSIKETLGNIKNNLKSRKTESSYNNEDYGSFQREISALRNELNQKEQEVAILNSQINNLQRSIVRENEKIADRIKRDEQIMTMNAPFSERYNRIINSNENLTNYGFIPCAIETGPGINGCRIIRDDPKYAKFYYSEENGSVCLYPAKDINIKQLNPTYNPYFNINGNGSSIRLTASAVLVKNGMVDCYDILKKGIIELA